MWNEVCGRDRNFEVAVGFTKGQSATEPGRTRAVRGGQQLVGTQPELEIRYKSLLSTLTVQVNSGSVVVLASTNSFQARFRLE